MAKENEVAYIDEVARLNEVSLADFQRYLLNKPFSDPRCGEYLTDAAQIISLLPQAPAKILDVGVGSGWTSELFARAGYDVTGIDISPGMIALAKQRQCAALFLVTDYEAEPIADKFHAAVIYDALHHAENEFRVIKNIYDALLRGGRLITIEPGRGHSKTLDSIDAMKKYGTTEKDMPFSLQRKHMLRAGFSSVRQYPRLSTIRNSTLRSLVVPIKLFLGASSVVVAVK